MERKRDVGDDREEHDDCRTMAMQRWSRTDRLSKKFDKLPSGDPFAKAASSSNFSFVYSQGGIPCRINHGGVYCRLQWDEDPAVLDYDPLLVTISEGLRETKHPYVFVAQAAFKEMLEAPGAAAKATPLVAQIVRNLRACMLSKAEGPFGAALAAIRQLSDCVKDALTPHMGALLIQINKKSFERKYKDAIFDTLVALDANGGPAAAKLIKAKVPCFSHK
ncbi:PACRG-like protein [Hondaea fermentalgiana]|uniref:PACRG-like protein n=1 Tax=Hondaea fermentalgiana TaxID=2315210 RepID=A0A2R5GPJ5_9STRA|nr:PACRG-like protein [Hondaea fermentalgiana]|eukprot:GBG30543.1 PACRG-like protein [Hondaea fermentalgiana]